MNLKRLEAIPVPGTKLRNCKPLRYLTRNWKKLAMLFSLYTKIMNL